MEAHGETHLPLTRDKAGLPTVPVQAGDTRLPFVFDTGANLSVLTATTAQRLGLTPLVGTIEVDAVTGNTVQARLAVAPRLQLGATTLRNVVFLVMEDAALSFPQIDYRIEGILGFPVIAALGPLTLTREAVHLPAAPSQAAAEGAGQNLCLAGLLPLVDVRSEGERMTFSFDTGAQKTLLYPRYFASRAEAISARGAPLQEQVGGAGGVRQLKAYVLEGVPLQLSGRDVTLPHVKVLTESLDADTAHLFGNLGQDVFGQFERLTLDFQRMRLVLE